MSDAKHQIKALYIRLWKVLHDLISAMSHENRLSEGLSRTNLPMNDCMQNDFSITQTQ